MQLILWVAIAFSTFALFSYCFYTFLLTLLPRYEPPAHSGKDARIAQLYIMIPCANEERVIGETLSSILQYAPEDAIIYVVDDASADRTPDIVREMGAKKPNVRLFQRVKPNAQKGKGAALNDCLQTILADAQARNLKTEELVIGIFDADTQIDEKYFPAMLACFRDPEVGQAQSRVKMIHTSTFLQKMQNYEFMLPITAIQNAREYTQSVCMGGNGQFMRVSSMLMLGKNPWGNCLLEDFEIGMRMLLLGQKARFCINSVVQQQALKSYKRFVRQRSRWVQGNIQAAAYLPDIIKAKVPALVKVDLIYFIYQSWGNLLGMTLQAVMLVFFAVQLVLFLDPAVLPELNMTREGLNMLALVALFFIPSVMMMLWRRSRLSEKGPFLRDLWYSLMMPIYYFLIFPAVPIAFWRQATGKHSWIKTARDV